MLTTERLHLRELTPEDRSLFLRTYTNADLMSFIREPMSYREADTMLTEALIALIDHSFQALDYYKLAACCISENAASRRVLEKAGFSK